MKAMNHGVVFKEHISGVINSAQRPEPGRADRSLHQARCPAPCHPPPPSQPRLSQPSARGEAATLPLWFFSGADRQRGSSVAGNELGQNKGSSFGMHPGVV